MRGFIFLLLLNLKTFAASPIYGDNSEILNSNYEPNYLTLVFGLILVICLIYLVGLIYQKLIKVKLGDIEETLTILNTLSLGQGKNLHIIKINSKYILIGATQNSITFLKDLNREDFEDA